MYNQAKKSHSAVGGFCSQLEKGRTCTLRLNKERYLKERRMTTIKLYIDGRFRVPGGSSSDLHWELREESLNLDSCQMRVDKVPFVNSFWSVDGMGEKYCFS